VKVSQRSLPEGGKSLLVTWYIKRSLPTVNYTFLTTPAGNKAKTATYDNDMDGFPRDQIETVIRLKELLICRCNIRILGTFANAVTAQAQAIYEPDPPYTSNFDILQRSHSGTFFAYVMVYPDPITIHSRKCLLSGQSTKSAVNALEDLWNKIQTDVNVSLKGRN
jgi:hypothetical protein